MALSFEYSVLRLIPDPRRGECVNIGIAIFLEDRIDVHILPSLNKAKALNGQIDIKSLFDLPNEINEWVNGIENKEDRINALRNFGLVTVSKPGWFILEQPSQYDATIKRLMNELVIPNTERTRSLQSSKKLSVSIKDKFMRQGILGKTIDDISKHMVVPKFPIDENEHLYADFALKNGLYRITETVDFTAASKGSTEKSRESAFAAITLDKAKKKFGENTKTYVIYAASARAEEKIQPQLNLLSEYAGKVLNYNSKNDFSIYIDEMMEAASSNLSITSH